MVVGMLAAYGWNAGCDGRLHGLAVAGNYGLRFFRSHRAYVRRYGGSSVGNGFEKRFRGLDSGLVELAAQV